MFPPKEIRERLNLKPNTRVLYRENRGVLMVEPVPTLEELLSEPPVMEVTLEELRDLRSELSRRAEE
ncbi:MAG TPA: AbrB/MazE/SpoVT family DNA-binding domain-containing protein [Candidatus Desulfaltia sp.]|nr:AbrB/MazE/SpoVT family DNA-binding domain-containing protein [Candidatus Desulfaltia sp.]